MCKYCERARSELQEGLPSSTGLTSGYEDFEISQKDQILAEKCNELAKKRINVTILTGFLGSGKTTLLNYILSTNHGLKLAVIENEFGECALDNDLLLKAPIGTPTTATVNVSELRETEIITTANGCVCCRVREDFCIALKKLISKHNDMLAIQKDKEGTPNQGGFDGIIIELSGLAELSPVIQTFFKDPFIQAHLHLDAVICLCDSRALVNLFQNEKAREQASSFFSTTTNDKNSEASALPALHELIASQIAMSDKIILNKMDLLMTEKEISRQVHKEEEILIEQNRRQKDDDENQNANTKDNTREELLEKEQKLLFLHKTIKTINPNASIIECSRGRVNPSELLNCNSFAVEAIDSFQLNVFFESSDSQAPPVREENHYPFNDFQHHHHSENKDIPISSSTSMSQAKKSNSSHLHTNYCSLALEDKDGPLDKEKIMSYIYQLLETIGHDTLCRFKGILWTCRKEGYTMVHKRFILHGVFGHVEVEEDDWPRVVSSQSSSTDLIRRSRLVFIGNFKDNENHIQQIKEGFKKCKFDHSGAKKNRRVFEFGPK